MAAIAVPIVHFLAMLFREDYNIGMRAHFHNVVRTVKILFQAKKLRMSSSINNDMNEGKFIVLVYNDSGKF